MTGKGKTYSIAVVGDSIGQTSHYPRHLQESLGRAGVSATVQDMTISGRTSSYAIPAAREIAARVNRPDLVIMELGGNDILSGRNDRSKLISPSVTRQNLETAIQILQKSGVKVMIAGIQAPAFAPPEYRQAFNAIVPDLAKKYHLVADPLFISPVIVNPNGSSPAAIFNRASMNSDLVHPNDLGGVQIANRMTVFVERALGMPNAPPIPKPASAFAPN